MELELRLDKAEVKAKRDAERIIAAARETAEAAFAEIDRMRSAANDAEDHRAANEARAELQEEPQRGRGALCRAPRHAAGEARPTRPAVRATRWSS